MKRKNITTRGRTDQSFVSAITANLFEAANGAGSLAAGMITKG